MTAISHNLSSIDIDKHPPNQLEKNYLPVWVQGVVGPLLHLHFKDLEAHHSKLLSPLSKVRYLPNCHPQEIRQNHQLRPGRREQCSVRPQKSHQTPWPQQWWRRTSCLWGRPQKMYVIGGVFLFSPSSLWKKIWASKLILFFWKVWGLEKDPFEITFNKTYVTILRW